MKIKRVLPFLFIFTLIFFNLLPVVNPIVSRTLSISFSMQYMFMGLFQLGLLIIFCLYLKQNHINNSLITLFSCLYVIIMIINYSSPLIVNLSTNISNLFPEIHEVDQKRFFDFLDTLKYVDLFIIIGFLTCLSVVFINIIAKLKYNLSSYNSIIIATTFYFILTVIDIILTRFPNDILKNFVDYTILSSILNILLLISSIFFKVLLVRETILYIYKEFEKQNKQI